MSVRTTWKRAAAMVMALTVSVGAVPAGVPAGFGDVPAAVQAAETEDALSAAGESYFASAAGNAEADAQWEAAKAYKEAVYNAYLKLAEGLDVNILVVGDSIGSGAGADDTAGGPWEWDLQLAGYLTQAYCEGSGYGGTIRVTNISMGGNSSYAGYIGALSLDDGIEYDLVILCYGQNDVETDFSLYYEAMIRAVQRHYPGCEIIAVLESSQLTYTAKIREIQKLCSHYGIPTADTIAAFAASGYDVLTLTSDGTHPNNLGQTIYAQTIAAVIDSEVLQAVAELSEAAAAGTLLSALQQESAPAAYNKEVSRFDHLRCYPAGDESADGVTQFVRVDDTTYTIAASASGVLGIDFLYDSGDGRVQVYLDGVLYESPVLLFECGFAQRYLLVVDTEVTVAERITVVFDTKEEADGFLGVYFSWG